MIYQQQTVVAADAPAMKETAAAPGSSLSCFCAAAAADAAETADGAASAVTAAASSGSYCLCASAAETADGADVAITSANFSIPKRGAWIFPAPLFLSRALPILNHVSN